MKKQLLSTTLLLLTLAILLPSISCASGQGRGPKGVPPETIEPVRERVQETVSALPVAGVKALKSNLPGKEMASGQGRGPKGAPPEAIEPVRGRVQETVSALPVAGVKTLKQPVRRKMVH